MAGVWCSQWPFQFPVGSQLGSFGPRVLTASQVSCGEAQGILGGPVDPQAPGEGCSRVLREGLSGILGVQ